jgi:hypothetical protein
VAKHKKNPVTRSQRIEMTLWINRNKKMMAEGPSCEACKAMFADTGISVPEATMRVYAREMGIKLFNGRTGHGSRAVNVGDGFSRDAIVARAIRHLYAKLNEDCPWHDELTQIVARKTPGNIHPESGREDDGE